MRALLLVDVQNDFIDGALKVPGALEVAESISDYVDLHSADYHLVVASKDWHVAPKGHFSDQPDYRDTWPQHCLAGREGADLYKRLKDQAIDFVVYKGAFSAAYSAFEGMDQDDRDLDKLLLEYEISQLDICGIATDYCVHATAGDAIALGYDVTILSKLCAAVNPISGAGALDDLLSRGAKIDS